MSEAILSYPDIQTRVENLYKSAWFQPNAVYPITFKYTTKSVEDQKKVALSEFFRRFYNAKLSGDLATKSSFAEPQDGRFKSISDIYAAEKDLTGQDLPECLNYFSTIEGLSPFGVPLTKTNGAINADKDVKLGGNGSCTLKFLCDREMKALEELQKWQSKWVSFGPDMRSLVAHGIKEGGEGYLSLLNCNVKTDGTIEPLSHFAVFGLIPKTINLKSTNSLGPRANASNLPEIEVICLYSSAILSVQRTTTDKDGKVSTKVFHYYFK